MVDRAQRVAVFLDWQNVYNHAREAFHAKGDPHVKGQVHPLDLAQTLTERGPAGTQRELVAVRIYRGMPDQGRDPKGYGAARRQTAAWSTDSRLVVVHRSLRYPAGYLHGTTDRTLVKEKGVDVALALDFAALAADGMYDTGILMSCDHDLLPAVERVVQRGRTRGSGARVEFASWQSPAGNSPRMRLPGESIFNHWLDQQTYWGLTDDRNYAMPSPAEMGKRSKA